MLTRRTVILAKVEGTYGVDPTPTASNDAILVSSPDIQTQGELHIRDYVREDLSPIGHVTGKKKVMVSFECELKGSGTAGTAPEYGPLLQACGLEETVSASTSVTYAPEATAADVKSVTMYVYWDGMMHEINGARGTFSINMEAGNFGRIQFNMTGKYVTPVAAALPTGTFQTTVPPLCTSASFAVDTYAAVCNAVTFDIANTIGAPGNLNSSDGYGDFQITARDSQGSIDPEASLTSTQTTGGMTAGFWADWESATGRALTITIGATAGNICDIDMPKIVPREVNFGDREGVRTFQIPYTAAVNSGSDEIAIVFT